MKRLPVIAAVFLVLIPSFSFAAAPDSTTADPGRPNSLRAGAWSAQFMIDGWFSTAGVFFKRHLSANHAIRFGASFSIDAYETDASLDTSTVVLETLSETRDYYSVSLELIAMRYANPLASAHVFYGIGPFFGFSDNHIEGTFAQPGGESFRRVRDDDAWRVGAIFVIGAEWFASRALSLDVEYSASLGYRSISREFTDEDTGPGPDYHTVEETDNLFINGGSARFSLGIYF